MAETARRLQIRRDVAEALHDCEAILIVAIPTGADPEQASAHCALVTDVYSDPGLWGSLLHSIVDQIARGYARATGMNPAAARDRIFEIFDAARTEEAGDGASASEAEEVN